MIFDFLKTAPQLSRSASVSLSLAPNATEIMFCPFEFIRIILNSNGTEFTSSFRGFNLVKLKNFSFSQVDSKGYSFFMETVIRINRLGFKSFEFPIHFKNREHGVSKIPKIEILRTLFNVSKLFLKKH